MKNARQQKILELIEKYDINTQEALIEKLKESGFAATQTTISRDINHLKLVKAASPGGTYRYVLPTAGVENGGVAVNSAISNAVIKIEAAKNIVVLRTFAGMANAVAVGVDSLAKDQIIGSVAGDDTILIVVKDDEIALRLSEKLRSVFGR